MRSKTVDGASALKTSSLTIVREHCAKFRHRASLCTRCTDVCPAGALNLSQNYPSVHAEVCKQCGACAAVCPTGAFEISQPVDEELAQMIEGLAKQKIAVTLVCKEVAHPPAESISVTCLARIDSSLLLFAVAQGAPEIRWVTADCATCSLAGVLPHQRNTIATTKKLLAALEVRANISMATTARAAASKPIQSEIDSSRRSFLRRFGRASVIFDSKAQPLLIADVPQPDAAQNHRREELTVYLPEKRKRWTQSMNALLILRASGNGKAIEFPVPQLDSASCSGCLICAKSCPTGALAYTEDEKMLCITLDASMCVACNLCVELCHGRALSLSSGDLWHLQAPRRVLIERERNGDLLASLEDKMSRLIGISVYRT